jgi:Fic family protein
MSKKYPPFQITAESLSLCAEINRLLGQFEGLRLPAPQPQLRRKSRIKTIFSSLAIEGNRLTEKQVTDLINNKRVVGPPKDIIEVKNAIRAYDRVHSYQAARLGSLLNAHAAMLAGLAEDAGRLRARNVGIFKGKEVAHLAPKYQLVPKLMEDLFAFLKRKDNLHPLVKSSIFHYELEFIHPFSDGNGRMGRLWQTVILLQCHPLFEYIPIESVVREEQKEYYQALARADKAGSSTIFIEFMLKAILRATEDFLANIKPQAQTATTRLQLAAEHFGKKPFSRKDYLTFHKNISTATASRDLLLGVKENKLKKYGARALTRYNF